MDVTQLALTWVGGQTVKNLFDLHANLISTKVSASHRKSTQVHARPGQTESQETQVFSLRLRTMQRLVARIFAVTWVAVCRGREMYLNFLNVI